MESFGFGFFGLLSGGKSRSHAGPSTIEILPPHLLYLHRKTLAESLRINRAALLHHQKKSRQIGGLVSQFPSAPITPGVLHRGLRELRRFLCCVNQKCFHLDRHGIHAAIRYERACRDQKERPQRRIPPPPRYARIDRKLGSGARPGRIRRDMGLLVLVGPPFRHNDANKLNLGVLSRDYCRVRAVVLHMNPFASQQLHRLPHV